MSLHRATVESTSPLTVLLHAATTALPAKIASWSGYTAVLNDAVLVDFVADNRAVIVLGKDPT